jgi:hypothetical protein
MSETKEPKPSKTLFIELKENMTKLINEYAKKSNVGREDIGFAMGYVTNQMEKSRDGNEQLQYLLQTYFFTGVMYAKEYKFRYEQIDENGKAEIMKELNSKLKKMNEGFEKPSPRPSYMG